MNDETQPAPVSGEVIAPGVSVPRAALRFTFVRARGPGGQAVNKVSTAAQLHVAVEAVKGLDDAARARLRTLAGHRLTREDDLTFRSETHRSQLDNRRACLARFRQLVVQAQRPPKVRRKKKPTRAMIQRRLDRKRRQSEKKQRRRGGWD